MYSKITSARPRRSLARLTPALLLVIAMLATSASAAPFSPTVSLFNVEITDVREGSFVVSWTTDVAANGLVRCYTPGGTLVHQASDSVTSTTTHYVTIAGLNPITQYLCEAESGGVVANNGGARYAITTGPVLAIPPPSSNIIYGYVFKPNGTTAAPDVIVYLRLADVNGIGSSGQSQWGSARTEASGAWFYNLDNLRTESLAGYFQYTPGADNLEIWVQGGVDGTWGGNTEAITPIPAVLPAQLPDAVLDGVPLAATLDSFFVTAQFEGVLITWETASEVGNLGFNLYRALDPAGTQNLLTFVASQSPGSNQGFTYTWLDTDVVEGQTYFYWLETLDTGGTNRQYGPVSITYQAPTAVETTLLTAQPIISSALARWLLILLTLLGGFTFKLYRQSHQSTTR